MGKGSQPEAPAPPDYAAANREGIYADIETLPIRRLLDYAIRAGEKVEYAAPGAEKRYNETLKAQAAWDAQNADYMAFEAANPGQDDQFFRRGGPKRPEGNRPVVAREDMITADFTGKGDIDLSRLQAKLRGETAGLEAANQLGIAQEYAPQFQQLAIDALKRQDPEGYAGRQDLARGLRSDYSSQYLPTEGAESRLLREAAVAQSLRGGPTGSGYSALDALMRQTGMSQAGAGQDNFAGSDATQQARNVALQRGLADLERGEAARPAYSPLDILMRQAGISQAGSGQEDFAGSAETQRVRNAALQRGLDDFALGSQLSGEQARQVEQSVRGAAAARGQALSAGGALQEIIGKYNVGEQLRQQRLNNLVNIGQQAFAQEQAVLGNRQQQAQQRLQNLFGAQQTEYGQERGDLANRQQQAQLGLSNLMSAGGQAFAQEQTMAGSRAQQAQQRLQNLFGAQQAEYGQEQGMLANRQQQAQLGLANLFNAQSTQFGQEQALRQETQQQQQRRLSNLQQYALGAPISSQFQSLQGAQQSASPYTPIMAQGIGQNANAGQQAAGFAGNIFGTQAQLYNTQMANSGGPWGDIAGSVLGAAAGSAFGKGGMFGQKMQLED